ncbi:hypothetical protein [Sphingomonas sp. Leaf4]|uniref:hypothetical protein n=1 Tax=Sphingomonas sp. Leaf4 TaxID=2876553 RepID=UPI001E4515BE|nr:hypothetical protein [Sphingomonas sp. Leaf4]
MEKLLLAAVSAFIGFILSQSINVFSYVRRPKFRTKHHLSGVISTYSGDPPETPWEIELGFLLENFGYNPAINTRVFISNIACSTFSEIDPELTSDEMVELKRPIDMIPSGECVSVKIGTIRGDKAELDINSQSDLSEEYLGMFGADTRGAVRFSAKFYVMCDDKNSLTMLNIEFRPDRHEFSSDLIQDFTPEYVESITLPTRKNS